MSTTSASFPFSSRIASPSPSASQSGAGGNGAPNTFYKNLFYILIGLLCAFGLVSFLSLLRARRRRAAILREAERLGVLVPGIPGYIPLRDRDEAAWTRPDGTISPDWWEVKQDSNVGAEEEKDGTSIGNGASVSEIEFSPLAIIPPVEERRHDPPPVSSLTYFPNHLAYRPDSLFPPPSRFTADSLSSLDGLAGEHVEVLTIIQMPTPPWPAGREVSEEEEVIKEWSGIELGMVRMDVKSGDR